MYDDSTAELILTADGILKNFVFVEELINSAPIISGWRFTAHKPASDIESFSISMGDYNFDIENLHFFPNEDLNYPDEIDITVVYNNYNEDDSATINGVYIYLDNYLGELESMTTVDSITVIGNAGDKKLISFRKLKDYLIWRQKEFIEKYDGIRYDTADDEHSIIEADMKSRNKLLAVINTNLLKWDRKASHPWILMITINFDGEDRNGMPDDDTYQLLNEIEDKLLIELKDYEGYLYVGRQTADSVREIYFACKDFRKPSKVTSQIKENYSSIIDIDYDIYIDKYWKSFNRLNVN